MKKILDDLDSWGILGGGWGEPASLEGEVSLRHMSTYSNICITDHLNHTILQASSFLNSSLANTSTNHVERCLKKK